ncbi:MAG: 3'-5' exonuclease [Flavobacteriales bacterium]|nr:3'-5' exonuclease [Flavobacteriales bacterium]
MDFLALDFETATPQLDSPCELGIAVVRGGVVREVHNWLIKPRYWPHFSPWNVAVHGIKPEDVAGAPRWEGIWDEVAKVLHQQTIVAHNASFDMSVLRATLASHGLEHPTFQYFCSISMCRKVWPGHPSYGLKAMCDFHGIRFKHHRAGNDAEATAELVLRALDQRPSFDMTQFLLEAKVKVGAFYPGGQRTPGGKLAAAASY